MGRQRLFRADDKKRKQEKQTFCWACYYLSHFSFIEHFAHGLRLRRKKFDWPCPFWYLETGCYSLTFFFTLFILAYLIYFLLSWRWFCNKIENFTHFIYDFFVSLNITVDAVSIYSKPRYQLWWRFKKYQYEKRY